MPRMCTDQDCEWIGPEEETLLPALLCPECGEPTEFIDDSVRHLIFSDLYHGAMKLARSFMEPFDTLERTQYRDGSERSIGTFEFTYDSQFTYKVTITIVGVDEE